MEKQTLQAEVREARGKGPARRLRAQGKIPAVFYGPGLEPTPLTVSPKELMKALSSEYGRNALLSLQYGGREELAMLKTLDQDPVTYEPIHADLYRVGLDRTVDVRVPFKTTGRAIGVQKGGELNVTVRSVPLRCTPDKIPAKIEIDVSKIDLMESITVGDLALAAGVEVLLPSNRTLAAVVQPRRALPEGEGEGTPGEAAKAAAPAKGK